MSDQKHKSQAGFGISRLSNNPANLSLVKQPLIAGKKVDKLPHSSFYLFDDDYDFAVPGRKKSGIKKSGDTGHIEKGNKGAH